MEVNIIKDLPHFGKEWDNIFPYIIKWLSSPLSLSKFLQMKLNSFLFRFLPFSVSRWHLLVLGRLYYFLNWTEKALIRKTIHHVFKRKFPAPVLNRKIKAAFTGIFDHYHEKLFVAYSNFPRLVKFLRSQVRFVGEDDLQAALQAGKGVIMVTGHFGAVEFLPGALALNGYPTSMICRFQTNPPKGIHGGAGRSGRPAPY